MNKLQKKIHDKPIVKTGACITAILIGAALDLGTKAWARANLEPYGPATDFLPLVSLRLTFNKGVSFSMLAFENGIGQALLIAATTLLTLIMAIWAYRSKGWQRAGLSMIVAGALANLTDRIIRGSVTDFFDLRFGEFPLFVFNLADVWITLGVGVLIVTQIYLAKNQ